MRRRGLIALIGAAVAVPGSAQERSSATPVVGFLKDASPVAFEHLVAASRKGLAEAAFVPGRNAEIEYRWAEGRFDRLAPLANHLVRWRRCRLLSRFPVGGRLALQGAAGNR
jgi:putative ABC transport system substrate-binding protein